MEGVLFPDNAFNAYTLECEMKIGRCWVVERRTKVVAYLLARQDGSLLDVMRVGVMPEFQGKGIGTMLMEMVLTQASEVILSVRKDNTSAVKLYRKLGFSIIGEIGDAASWVMRATSGETRSDARLGT
jgi:ribosomal protein S18 acetylase RimI-like enzyme